MNTHLFNPIEVIYASVFTSIMVYICKYHASVATPKKTKVFRPKLTLVCFFTFCCKLDAVPVATRQSLELEKVQRCFTPDGDGVLDFSNMGFSYVPSACRPETVKSLILRYNNIPSLNSSSLSAFANLESLDVSFNQLARIDRRTFNRLSKLREVSLAYNNLSHLPNKLFMYNTKLETLDLSNNLLTSAILRSRSLKTLDLSYNKNLNATVDETFNKLPALTDLNLSFCDLRRLPYQSLKRLTKLKVLNVGGNIFPCNEDLNNLIVFDPYKSKKQAAVRCLDSNGKRVKLWHFDFSRNNFTPTVTHDIFADDIPEVTSLQAYATTTSGAINRSPTTTAPTASHEVFSETDRILNSTSEARTLPMHDENIFVVGRYVVITLLIILAVGVVTLSVFRSIVVRILENDAL